MALQIWLPLTKDLRQQGLSSIVPINNGNIIYSSTGGKLGGCYVFDGVDDAITVGNLSTLVTDSFSFACWFYHDNTWSSKNYETLFGGPSGFELEAKNGGTNSPVLRLYNWGGSTCAYELNKWNHVVFTRNTTETKLYLNGELKLTGTAGTIPSGNYFVGSWSSTTGQNYKGKMNDVRIYDHCLSPMEVKELAKGLVLHYPLNRQGWGQENLMPNSVEMPVGSANPSTGTWRLAGGSQMTRSRVAISDAPTGASTYGFQSIGLQTGQDASCWGIDGFPRENGTTYTLSAWGRIVGGSTTAAMLGFSVYSGTTLDYGGTYGQAKSSDIEYYGSGAYDYAGGRLNPNGSWTRIYRTFTSTSTSDNIYIGFNTAKTGNNVILQLCGVKLEKSDKMTSWVPHNEESLYTTMGLNSTTEYDCSGFCNNGTRTGTFSWSSDTPKYNVSTVFNGSSCIDTNINYLGNEWSYGGWIYSATSSRSWEGVLMLNGTNPADADLQFGFYTCPKSNIIQNSANGKYNSSISWTYGAWHHFMGTYDGATLKTYIDGVLVNSTGITQAFLERHNFVIGARHSSGTNHDCYFLGNISDVRIYATALSADDVLSLYQNNAYIDTSTNPVTIYGKIRD